MLEKENSLVDVFFCQGPAFPRRTGVYESNSAALIMHIRRDNPAVVQVKDKKEVQR
jgi:hypothetical protein